MRDLQERIAGIGVQLAALRGRLLRLGYQFREPELVLPGPATDVEDVISQIESEAGRVPEALKCFYRRIGSVNFLGAHPEWGGCEYPDALVVDPISVALGELDNLRNDREEYLAANEVFRLPIAPDAFHKEDVSGGMWYNVAIPSEGDDPALADEPHETTFLNYLEIAIRWGGFPGLESSPDHDWPLAEIVGGVS